MRRRKKWDHWRWRPGMPTPKITAKERLALLRAHYPEALTREDALWQAMQRIDKPKIRWT